VVDGGEGSLPTLDPVRQMGVGVHVEPA